MIRSILCRGGPILMTVFPFNHNSTNPHDKPVNSLIKPLVKDELAWDKVKNIFKLKEDGMITKELQSIISITFTGTIIGAIIGGISATKLTVDNFIMNNEATKFPSHFDAKRSLQQAVAENFIKKGGRLAAKLGMFCFLFSTITTCTTAYRGRLTVANYMIGGSIAGFLYKINLGFRGAFAGTVVGCSLGGICGILSISILYLAGVSMDEVLEVQQGWITARNELLDEKIKTYMAEYEKSEEIILYKENQELQKQLKKDVKDHNK